MSTGWRREQGHGRNGFWRVVLMTCVLAAAGPAWAVQAPAVAVPGGGAPAPVALPASAGSSALTATLLASLAFERFRGIPEEASNAFPAEARAVVEGHLAVQRANAALALALLDRLEEARGPGAEPELALDLAETVLASRWALLADEPRGSAASRLLPGLQAGIANVRVARALLDASRDAPGASAAAAVARVAAEAQARALGFELPLLADPADPAVAGARGSPGASGAGGIPGAAFALLARHGVEATPEQEASLIGLERSLPEPARSALERVIASYLAFEVAVAQAYAIVDPALLPRIAALAEESARGSDRAGAELRDLAVGAGLDLGPVVAARGGLLDAALALNEALAVTSAKVVVKLPTVEIPPVLLIRLNASRDVYRDNYRLLVDGGGNDRYLNNAGGNVFDRPPADCAPVLPLREATAAALLDLRGNDTYDAFTTACGKIGGGAFGAGFLFDAAGRDSYSARGLGVNGGAALLGTGFLMDADGDDKYTGLYGGANGGSFGGAAGLLVDLNGTDLYCAAGCFGNLAPAPYDGCGSCGANGGAYLWGSGFLVDARGHDRHDAAGGGANGGASPQGATGFLFDGEGVDRYSGRNAGSNGGAYHQDSVGFLFDGGGDDLYGPDWIPYFSGDGATGQGGNGGAGYGGVGVLVDAGGNDTYNAGRRGQNGGAKWTSFGLLVDANGNDRYYATSEATNGAAYGFGLGHLVDGGGKDGYYALHTAANGGGIEGGAGFLLDAGTANEKYVAGCCGANGAGIAAVGFLLDGGGSDEYRHQYGGGNGAAAGLGVGALLDAGDGQDSYSGERNTNGGSLSGLGLLLDGGGAGDTYTDLEGYGGRDRPVVPKGTLGAQVDTTPPGAAAGAACRHAFSSAECEILERLPGGGSAPSSGPPDLLHAQRALDLARAVTGAAAAEAEEGRSAIGAAEAALAAAASRSPGGELDPQVAGAVAVQRAKLSAARGVLDAGREREDEDPLQRAVRLTHASSGVQASVLALSAANLPSSAIEKAEAVGAGPPSEAVRALLASHGVEAPDAEIRALDDLPDAVGGALARLVRAFLDLEASAATARLDLSHLESGALDDGGRVAAVLDARARFLDAAAKLREATAGASFPVANALVYRHPPVVALDLVGGNSLYAEDYALLVDVGGNDVYRNNAGGSGIRPDPKDPLCPPGGVAALVDLRGDDRYVGGRFCGNGGAGAGGVGVLVDAAGSDTYLGGRGSNGGAYLGGLGLLLDAEGKDHYAALGDGNGVNGGAFGGGLGLLVDAAGNDAYVVGSGACCGVNGGAAFGGAGHLVDAGGNDLYDAANIGAHGGAHVRASGFLLDASGDDTYRSTSTFGRGVAGGGSHRGSAGFLLDGGGSDTYNSTTSGSMGANGGGYAEGVGLLVDLGSGNDKYLARGPSANGGASTGGLGHLVDGGGDDHYWLGSGGNGAAAYGFRSLGFLVDLGGNDHYDAPRTGPMNDHPWVFGSAVNGGAFEGSSGFLLDASGNDRYVAGRAGPANGGGARFGAGALVDLAGNDLYEARESDVANGGAWEGFGLLFDGGGRDDYFEKRADGGTGTDRTAAPKGPYGYGAQVDFPPRLAMELVEPRGAAAWGSLLGVEFRGVG